GAGCEVLADAGRCAGPMKRGPRSEKCRGGAPRGAPAGVIGRLVSFARETGPTARRATGTAFRASACRRSAPLISGSKRKDGVPRAAKNRGSEALATAGGPALSLPPPLACVREPLP